MQLRTVCAFTFFAFRNGNHYADAFHPIANTRTTSHRLNHPSRAKQNFLIGNNYFFLEEQHRIPTSPYLSTKRSTSALNGVISPLVVWTASITATSKILSSIGYSVLHTSIGPKAFGNILDDDAVKVLSKLIYWIFQPCFLFCTVASTMNTTYQDGIGGLSHDTLVLMPLAALIQVGLGSIMAKVLTTKHFSLRSLLLGLDGNDDDGANDVSMCITFANSGPLPLILSHALFEGELLSDVTACISFYLLLWSPLFWSFGKAILGLSKGTHDNNEESFVNGIKLFLNPPVLGSISGVAAGSSPLVQSAILMDDSYFRPFFEILSNLGSAYLPAAVLVLGGSIVQNKESTTPKSDWQKSSSSGSQLRTIATLVVTRFVLSPMIAFAIVKYFCMTNLVEDVRTQAIVAFTLLLEGSMPPAQNSIILLQLSDKRDRAENMAKLLSFMYAISAIPVTVLISFSLASSDIMQFQQ
ncbi:hypothetical protein CTEN210_09387 [Chaetoceros tenuissimus]|uniref:Uncharacterized protein n=1 Tax=Chaetoceros tenuissimus TaxID=426638 RepID=A0AAD3CXF7_9STRA|nr:hypothetical protein CTEN210_09387 [Chaetoceros tenuissimus]